MAKPRPMTVIDLTRVRRQHPDLPPVSSYVDLTAQREPIRVRILDRAFLIPPGATRARYGGSVADGSFTVEYEGPGIPWTRAEEATTA